MTESKLLPSLEIFREIQEIENKLNPNPKIIWNILARHFDEIVPTDTLIRLFDQARESDRSETHSSYYVRLYVSQLRRVLEEESDCNLVIQNHPHKGYSLTTTDKLGIDQNLREQLRKELTPIQSKLLSLFESNIGQPITSKEIQEFMNWKPVSVRVRMGQLNGKLRAMTNNRSNIEKTESGAFILREPFSR